MTKINTDKELLNKSISKKTFVYYSVLFCITCIAIYSYYFFSKGSFIWESDGFSQHFQLFNEYIDILQGVLRGEGFSEWNWSIGAGADTITSYGYYVIGDPFVYLGVLFPESLREFSFHLLIFARMWCVGLSYLIFAKSFKVSNGSGLLGAFMYTFSFFVIYNAKRHPFFILPVIWYPLLCLGVEKILKKESGLLFSVMVAISAISNFYFFYKLSILTFMYALVRYGMMYEFKDWRKLGSSFLRCLFHYLVGLLISSIVFLPMVVGFLNSSRGVDGVAINLFLYHISYYAVLIHNLFVPYSYFWSVGGVSVFSLFTIIFLLKTKKKKTFSGIMLIILGIFLLFPFIGSFMNGMSGPYNRFSFAIPLFLSFASGQFLEERDKLQIKELILIKNILIVFSVIYGIVAFVRNMYIFYMTPIVLGWIIWYVLVYESKKSVKIELKNKITLVLVVLVILNMSTNAMNLYFLSEDSISNTIELNTSMNRYENLYGGIQELLPQEELYRVGVTSQDSHVRNQFIYHDLMGLSTYLSVTNGFLAEFAKEMEIASYQIIQPLRNGVDDRKILNHFFNIEYILTEEINKEYIPEGYKVVYSSDEKPSFIIAKTENHFPFAYVEDTMILRKDFSKLNPLEKEVFLTEGVVLETYEEFQIDEFDGESQFKKQIKEVEYKIEYNDPKVQPTDDGMIEVRKSESRFKISLEDASKIEGHDVFIYLQGLDYKSIDIPFYMPDDPSYNIRFLYEGREKTFRQSDKYSFSTYFHRENMFVNLGHTDLATEDIYIQFQNTGKYKIDDLTIFALPIDKMEDKLIADEKRKNALDITVFEDEVIEGIIQREKPGILVTTIPYEKGWSVTVNGKNKEIIQVNIGFIGLPLDSGKSEIIFSYQNPYLKIGRVLSLIGILLLVLIQIRYRKNTKIRMF